MALYLGYSITPELQERIEASVRLVKEQAPPQDHRGAVAGLVAFPCRQAFVARSALARQPDPCALHLARQSRGGCGEARERAGDRVLVVAAKPMSKKLRRRHSPR